MAQSSAASVDRFLWRGSPSPSMAQRFAAWFVGMTFIGLGIVFWAIARGDASWTARVFGAVIGLAPLVLGLKIFRNGFPRR
jgi:hypothetical protein